MNHDNNTSIGSGMGWGLTGGEQVRSDNCSFILYYFLLTYMEAIRLKKT